MATLGTLVRSPDSFLTSSPSILPFTTISKCALVSVLVVWMDFCNRPAASGRGSDDFDEHPAAIRAVTNRAVRAAIILRLVDIPSS